MKNGKTIINICSTIYLFKQNASSVDNIVAMADETVEQAEEVSEQAEGQDEGLFSILKPVQEKIAQVTAQAQATVNGFIEALAVMIVTSCIIPVLVLVFFLWLVKMVLGVNIDVPMQMLQPRSVRHITRRFHKPPAMK